MTKKGNGSKSNGIKINDVSKPYEQLTTLRIEDLMRLPYPLDSPEAEPPIGGEPKDDWRQKYATDLDGYICIDLPFKPRNEEEGKKLTNDFLEGLKKLTSRDDNWTFLQQFMLSMEYCAKCQTCNDACPIYQSSGKNEIYRPTYRSEILRRIYKKYLTPGGKMFGNFVSGDIDLNWRTVVRLAELSYRCTFCRRCAQTCPIGVDNGVINRELRKLFSQEMGIGPKPVHVEGTVKQLKTGSSTGLTPDGFKDMVEFIQEDAEERTGLKVDIPVDEKGADILLIHNAGEFLAWPDNPAAFAILFNEAGLSWTLSSEPVGYDGVNYGAFNDDVQLARIVLKHIEAARKLDVNKIVLGECGHAHKVLAVVADRILSDDLNIPRESCLPILRDMVKKKKLNLDPAKNDFPVTMHDPCSIVRMMGIVQPQREIINAICPQYREMNPNGVYNYCCGGGSGFAIQPSMNFPEWRNKISTRMKVKQIMEAFQDDLSPDTFKYACMPCSNCKGGVRDAISHYGLWDKCGIMYGGLVELMVNAMVDIEEPFIEEEFQ